MWPRAADWALVIFSPFYRILNLPHVAILICSNGMLVKHKMLPVPGKKCPLVTPGRGLGDSEEMNHIGEP